MLRSFIALAFQEENVYVYDRLSGETELVSASSVGSPGHGNSMGGGISADGRVIVFQSFASDLVPEDTNGRDGPSSRLAGLDIFVASNPLFGPEQSP